MEIFAVVGVIIIAIGYWLFAGGRATEKRLGVSVNDIGFSDVGVDVPVKADPEKKAIKNLFSEK